MFVSTSNEFKPTLTPEEAYQIVFKDKFMFRLDPMALVDLEEVARRGTNTSGIARHDRAVNSTAVMRSLSVATAAEIKANRFRIGLVMPEMSVRMYEGLQSHLEHWLNQINRATMNFNSNPPLDDLVILEHFCQAVFMVARGYFKPGTATGNMFGNRLDLSKHGVQAVKEIFRLKDQQEKPEERGLFGEVTYMEDGLPQRESLMPHFSKAMLKREGL